MAGYLLSITSNGSLEPVKDLAPPAGYFLEWSNDATPVDGLEHWKIELQIAGTVGEWAKSPAYDAFWTFLTAALGRVGVRPRGTMTLKSRVDPPRLAVTFAYLGDHQLSRAREDLKLRISAALDPKSKRLKSDVELKM